MRILAIYLIGATVSRDPGFETAFLLYHIFQPKCKYFLQEDSSINLRSSLILYPDTPNTGSTKRASPRNSINTVNSIHPKHHCQHQAKNARLIELGLTKYSIALKKSTR